MPPPLPDSDMESDSSEANVPATKTLPVHKKTASKIPSPESEPSDAGDDDDASDAGVDEYVVEKIIGHRFVKGKLEYDVKWQGYDNPKDRTWEPEDNMEGAADVLAEYHEEIGGRPQPKGMKRKAAPTGGKSESGTPAASSKRGRPADDKPAPKVEKAWSPPPGSWEHDVSYVDTVEELSDGVDPKTGNKRVQAYVVWKNQRKTSHPLRLLYQKCPQKMLMYYETHLVFTTIDSKEDTNGGTAMQNS